MIFTSISVRFTDTDRKTASKPAVPSFAFRTSPFAIAFGALLSLQSAIAAVPWTAMSGYYPGMSKQQAKALGLQNCAPKPFTTQIYCNPTKPIKVGTFESDSADIALDPNGGFVTFITIHFPATSGAALLHQMQTTYGEAKRTQSRGECVSGEWDRKDDYKMEIQICYATGRYVKATGSHISLRYLRGRSAALKHVLRSEQDIKKNVDSFNSK